MGPLSFLNGAFLAALAAAALPILIHLFSRRRLREVPFSNVSFLDEITRRKVRRMRLRQWLLLALRTLAIAFLALALSRPVWQGAGAGMRRGSSTVAIVIDDSYSMEARTDPAGLLPVEASGSGLRLPTRFAEAQQRAREALGLLEEGDRAVLVFAAGPVEVPYENSVRDPALLIEEVERAKPRAGRADFSAALERVYPLLAASRTLNREIVVISDFQRNQAEDLLRNLGAQTQAGGAETQAGSASGWHREGGEPDSALGGVVTDHTRKEGRALLALPPDTRLYLLPVSNEASQNAAIVGALFESDPGGRGGRLTAQVRNFDERDRAEVTVQALGGSGARALLGEGVVTVEPGGAAAAVLTLPVEPDQGLLEVQSNADLLDRDNSRFVFTHATSRFRVLVVTGGPPERDDIREETRFALLALDPWQGQVPGAGEARPGDASAGEPSASEPAQAVARLFDVRTVAEENLGLENDFQVDAVVLLNVGRLSATAVERLERFHREGGGLLIALGDRVDPRLYNSQILPSLTGARVGNVLGETESEGRFTLRPSAVGQALFSGFPIAPGGALTGARFRRVIEVRPGAQTQTLAEFSSSLPALLEEPGVLLFASSLDMDWSDFPTSASYLPFLHRALLHLVLGGRVQTREPLVGEPLSWPLPREGGEELLRCVGPGGLEIPVRVARTDRGAALVSDPTPEPGFYRVVSERSPRGGPAEPVAAVNVDVRESDLRPMTPEQMRLLFGDDAITLSRDEEIGRQILETRHGRELWRLCLALAFAALLAESLIARGRGVS
ncbi:MAG: BatA domain-containing protein [Candidatus Eisenbacteria bacterium]|nr:BatA domain-containing protein [Candidatus Eisenbacteria bacterium]